MNPWWLRLRHTPVKFGLHAVDYWERTRFSLRRGAPPVGERPRLALVGCGWFARVAHFAALQRLENQGLLEFAALCSRSEDSLARAARQLGRPRIQRSTDLAELFCDKEIDVVDLVLPIPAMPDAIEAALGAGKHVFSEKPCAPSVEEGLRLLNIHRNLSRPRIWAVGENWRFKKSVRRLEEIVRGGEIGEPQLIRFRRLFFFPPNRDQGWRGQPSYQGGHLLDVGVHFVALLRKVVGEVEQVNAQTSQRLTHLPPADSLHAHLRFESGVEGSFDLSFAARKQDNDQLELSVVGSRGAVHAHFKSGYLQVHCRTGNRTYHFPEDPWNKGGVYETLKGFFESLGSDEPIQSPSTPEEGLRDVAVIEAMLESARDGAAARPCRIPSP